MRPQPGTATRREWYERNTLGDRDVRPGDRRGAGPCWNASNNGVGGCEGGSAVRRRAGGARNRRGQLAAAEHDARRAGSADRWLAAADRLVPGPYLPAGAVSGNGVRDPRLER